MLLDAMLDAGHRWCVVHEPLHVVIVQVVLCLCLACRCLCVFMAQSECTSSFSMVSSGKWLLSLSQVRFAINSHYWHVCLCASFSFLLQRAHSAAPFDVVGRRLMNRSEQSSRTLAMKMVALVHRAAGSSVQATQRTGEIVVIWNLLVYVCVCCAKAKARK